MSAVRRARVTSSAMEQAELFDQIRELVEAVHGRSRPYTTIVLSQVIARVRATKVEDLEGRTRIAEEAHDVVAWVAKVKVGRVIVAKCCKFCHWTPVDALEELRRSTRTALGIR